MEHRRGLRGLLTMIISGLSNFRCKVLISRVISEEVNSNE